MAQSAPRAIIDRLAAGRWGPTRLALGLGLVSIPVVILALTLPSGTGGSHLYPPAFSDAVVIAVASVLGAAVVGGWLGGRLRRWTTISTLVAVAAAWLTGVTLLGFVPALLHMPYQAGLICIGICNAMVTSDNPTSGAMAWGLATAMGFGFVVPGLAGLAALVLAKVLFKGGDLALGATILVLGYGVSWGMGMLAGAPGSMVAYGCLAVGVVIWTLGVQGQRAPMPVVASAAATVEAAS